MVRDPVEAVSISGKSGKASNGITRGNGGQEELNIRLFTKVSSDRGGAALDMADNFSVLWRSDLAVRNPEIQPQDLFLSLT